MGQEQSAVPIPQPFEREHRKSFDATRPRSPRTPSLQRHKCSEGALAVEYERVERRPKHSFAGFEMGQQHSRRPSKTLHSYGEDGPNIQEHLKITAYQLQLLQTSWAKIKPNQALFTQVFKSLCGKSQVSKEMFQKMSIVETFKTTQCCDLNSHAKVMCDMFDELISNMHEPAKIAQSRLCEMGVAHWKMNEKSLGSVWEYLGECLQEVLTRADSVRGKREAVKAWMTLISFAVDSIKSGYMDEYRRQHNSARGGGVAGGGACAGPKISITAADGCPYNNNTVG